MRGWLLAIALSLGLAGCASSSAGNDAGPGDDAAGGGDAGADAGATPDAPVGTEGPPPGSELVSAGGRLQNGNVVMEVELGHWFDQTTASAGTRKLQGAAVIKR